MIKFENVNVTGWEHAIRKMRNSTMRLGESDSCYNCPYRSENAPICGNCTENICIGPNDLDLMLRLVKAGSADGKFRQMITVYVDLTAPLYWWKEFDAYEADTNINSRSIMRKIRAEEFTMEDFSAEHLISSDLITVYESRTDFPYYFSSANQQFNASYLDILAVTMEALNIARKKFLETKDEKYRWQIIQLLPSSYNQKQTVLLNYELLANIYQREHNSRLDEWRALCGWIENLPYSEIITSNQSQKIHPL